MPVVAAVQMAETGPACVTRNVGTSAGDAFEYHIEDMDRVGAFRNFLAVTELVEHLLGPQLPLTPCPAKFSNTRAGARLSWPGDNNSEIVWLRHCEREEAT